LLCREPGLKRELRSLPASAAKGCHIRLAFLIPTYRMLLHSAASGGLTSRRFRMVTTALSGNASPRTRQSSIRFAVTLAFPLRKCWPLLARPEAERLKERAHHRGRNRNAILLTTFQRSLSSSRHSARTAKASASDAQTPPISQSPCSTTISPNLLSGITSSSSAAYAVTQTSYN
jgi:hypothetical protein